jgi:SAM-dependent methyltransferase
MKMDKDLQVVQHIQDKYWSEDKKARRKPDHPVVRATFEPLADIVALSVTDPADSSVIDVGCGNGFLQWALERRFGSVTGLDYSQQMLDVNPCKNKFLGSCTSLPFRDKSFDVAVASHLLHHLTESDRIKALFEMRRVARQAVISFEPNRSNPFILLFSLTVREERMVLKFSRKYMCGLFEKAGLADVNSQIRGWIVPNKAPVWWVPVGRALGKTPLTKLGFDICTVGQVES